MKIVQLVNVRWYNASAWYGVNLSRILKKMGHEVIVAGLPDSPPIRKAKEYGLPTLEAAFNSDNPFKLFPAIRSFNRMLAEFQPDVVVTHRGEFFWYTALLRFLGKITGLIRVRGDIRPPKKGFLNRWLHLQCDGIVTSGKFMEQKLIDTYRLPSKKIRTIYGGIDTTLFYPRDRKTIQKTRGDLGIEDNVRLAGIVGRYDAVKGHDVLFKALDLCSRPIRLVVAVKEDKDIREIERLALEYGVQEKVIAVGHVGNIGDLMGSLDVGVISSLGSEAICRVGMEIMACGVPIITSDVGVLPEITEVLNRYPATDAEALAERLEQEHLAPAVSYSDRAFGEAFMSFVTKP